VPKRDQQGRGNLDKNRPNSSRCFPTAMGCLPIKRKEYHEMKMSMRSEMVAQMQWRDGEEQQRT